MAEVNVRDLRNHGGEVLDRVSAGETVTVVRSGTAVAELRPLPRPATSAGELVARRRLLPAVDPAILRTDIDEVLDSEL
jgi:prevent-host-death family protein